MSNDNERGRLRITRIYLADCGQCGADHQVTDADSYAEAQKRLQEADWKHTGMHGWICDRCAREAVKQPRIPAD